MRLPSGYIDKTAWARDATPRSLYRAPVHRWFVFPHSYSHTLVETIIEAWKLNPGDCILDPFVGAGTTLVVAKDRGIPAVGLDVSPLAVMVSQVKTADYDADDLTAGWQRVRACVPKVPPQTSPHGSPLVRRAFTPTAWRWLAALRDSILSVQEWSHRDFLQVAYLRTMREVCRALSDGGWLRWTRRRPSGADLLKRMDRTVAMMIADVRTVASRQSPVTSRQLLAAGRWPLSWDVLQGDARFLPKDLGKVTAVICSPPYPNRHDYSRVFAPELLLAFCDEDELKRLRYTSFRSHVEARDPGCPIDGYVPPPKLQATLRRLSRAPVTNPRVIPMVEGYFSDTFLMLRALRPHLVKGARLAFVVGNVRHAGIMVEVDEYLAQIAEDLGYRHEGSWVIRLRGNSAQQMEKFGRVPARESVVLLRWQ